MILAIFRAKCPNCRKGNLFSFPNPYNLKHAGEMPKMCQNCGQDFVVEPGFYFGAAYMSYILNVGWLMSTFLILYFGFDWGRQELFILILIATLVLFPLIFRLSRTLWLYSHYYINRKSS